MKCVRLPRFLALAASLLALQGCVQNVVIPVTLDGYVLTSANRIIGFGTADASRAIISTTVTGLATGETLLDIDYRNAEGKLYALSSAGKIYNVNTGTAQLIATLAPAAGDPFTALAPTARYTLDVDPVQDRLRVIGSNGDNLEVDMNNGLTTSATAVTAGTVAGLAHTDVADATDGRSTDLYGINTATDAVYLIDGATGAQTQQAVLGVDATSVLGYDINPLDGKGYAMMTVGGANGLYRIDETVTGVTPAAKRLSGTPAMFAGESIVGIAMLAAANPTVIALDNTGAGSALRQFAARTPATISSALTVTGLAVGETLLGIDARPADSKLYGLGSTGKIYRISAAGAATAVGPTLTLTGGHSYLIDMSSLVNTTTAPNHKGLMYVIDNTAKQQFTVDIDNSTSTAPVSITPATASLVGSAFSSAALVGTGQYVADLTSATLAVLADNGSITTGLATKLTLGSAAGLDVSGFFNENALLAGRSGSSGPFTLYQLSLYGSGATSLGVIGGSSGPAITDIAIRH